MPPRRITPASAVRSFLSHRRIRNCAHGTLLRYESQLQLWIDWREQRVCPTRLCSVAVSELRDFVDYLLNEHIPNGSNARFHRKRTTNGLAVSTVDTYWRTLRAFWGYAARERWLSEDQRGFFRDERIPRPRVPRMVRPTYTDADMEAMLAACSATDSAVIASRNAAALLLLRDSGMRAGEMCSLVLSDVSLRLRRALVYGKGGKERWVYFGRRTSEAITLYLSLRGNASTKLLFCNSRGDPLSPQMIRQTIRRIAASAGITAPPTAPVHATRHTFARNALVAGVDSMHLQQFLGHASIVTTQRYVTENPERLEKIYRQLIEFDEPA